MSSLKIIFIFLLCISAVSCKNAKVFSDNHKFLNSQKIIGVKIQIRDGKNEITKSIESKDSLIAFVESINESKVNGPWKGANWDRIIFTTNDSVYALVTNGKVFRTGSSGTFYSLDEKYQEFWKGIKEE